MIAPTKTSVSLVKIQCILLGLALLSLLLPWYSFPGPKPMQSEGVQQWVTLTGWSLSFSSVFAHFLIASFSISFLERRGAGAARFFHYSFFLATMALATYLYFQAGSSPVLMKWGLGVFLFFASNFFAVTAILSSGLPSQLKSGG